MARILVIEDNRTNLYLMRTILEGFGHVALLATSAREGLDLAHEEHPDLILLDVVMPEMTGLEALHSLKAEAAFKQTPIIAVTALALVGDRDELLAAGFDGYIAKPIAPQKLIAEIDPFLPPGLRSVPRAGVRLD